MHTRTTTHNLCTLNLTARKNINMLWSMSMVNHSLTCTGSIYVQWRTPTTPFLEKISVAVAAGRWGDIVKAAAGSVTAPGVGAPD